MLTTFMRLLFVFLLVSCIILPLVPVDAFTWGFYAHKLINKVAIDCLPGDMQLFFEAYRTEISEKAIDPDLWRNSDPEEAPRHFIDIDMYGAYPFLELPRDLEDAVAKFGAETVTERGIAPWWIDRQFRRLVKLMQADHTDSIIVVAAALGHYVSDLHMPLHTVENYDGQLSGNKGIHARFEWHMIERFSQDMELNVQPARYIEDPLIESFDVVLDSYRQAEAILAADDASKSPDMSYASAEDYDDTYYARLYDEVGEIAARRMSLAAQMVASYWYTAWLKAGKPQLSVRNTH